VRSVGKARLSLFKLRPRNTAVVVTILTGSIFLPLHWRFYLLLHNCGLEYLNWKKFKETSDTASGSTNHASTVRSNDRAENSGREAN